VPPQDPETARWFATQLQVHEPMLRAWLHSRFPQIADFDDIVQEAYSRVLAARAQRPLLSPKAFFFATARNLAFDHFRKSAVQRQDVLREFGELSVLDESVDIPETIARNQEIELMTQAIQTLPDRCRQVLTLRNVYGLSHKEIAAQLGLSIRTVETQVAVGIKRCTRFMAKFRNR
jgi:RNA polymerase sigma factor (sigma-70 family)